MTQTPAEETPELDQILRAAGLEYPLGLRGVRDLVTQRDGHLEAAREAEDERDRAQQALMAKLTEAGQLRERAEKAEARLTELTTFLQGRRRDCLRALRASTGESSQADYWRWQGHAELSRQLLERLGAEVPQ